MTYTHKKTLTVSVRPDTSLSDLPVLVRITADTDIGGRIADEDDIGFFTAGDVELDWIIAKWSLSGGSLTADLLVLEPSILSSADLTIVCKYGSGGTAAYSSTLAHGNCVGWWLLEGDNPTDKSGTGNNATSSSVTTGGGGKIGDALEFDGSSSTVTCGSAASLDDLAKGAMTVMAWIYPHNLGEGNLGKIAEKRDSINGGGWMFRLQATNRLNFYTITSTGSVTAMAQQVTANNAIATNTWQHVAVTYDDAGSRKGDIYVDGTEASYGTDFAATGTVGYDSAGDFTIGNTSGATDRTFDGLLDDVRVYSAKLDPDVIEYVVAQTNSPGSWGSEQALGGSETAGTAAIVATMTLPAVTAQYLADLTAGTAAVAATVTLPAVTSQYTEELAAGTAVVVATVTLPAVTAQYSSDLTAGSGAIAAAVALPAVTAEYSADLAAGTAAVDATLTLPAVTAQYLADLTAGTATIAAAVALPAVTAQYSCDLTAGSAAIVAAVVLPAVTAEYLADLAAGTAAVAATVTLPAVTAQSDTSMSAGTAAIAAAVTLPAVTAEYSADLAAGTDAIAATVTLPAVTAQYLADLTAGTSAVVTTVTLPAVTPEYAADLVAGTAAVAATVTMPAVLAVANEAAVAATVTITATVIMPVATATFDLSIFEGLIGLTAARGIVAAANGDGLRPTAASHAITSGSDAAGRVPGSAAHADLYQSTAAALS